MVFGDGGRGTVDEGALKAELLDGALKLVRGGLAVLGRDGRQTKEAVRVLLAVGVVLRIASVL